MEVKGILKRVGNTKQVSEKFKNRTFDIETTEGKYPQIIRLELSQDRCDLIDSYSVGQELNVDFNLNGREWQKTPQDDLVVFNTLSAWKIMATPLQSGGQKKSSEFDAPKQNVNEEEDTDLPF